MSQPSTTPTVERVEAERVYRIVVDGRRAGLTAYRDHGDQRVFYHTEVDDAYAGQGLAARLVREALTDSREQGKRIVPVVHLIYAMAIPCTTAARESARWSPTSRTSWHRRCWECRRPFRKTSTG